MDLSLNDSLLLEIQDAIWLNLFGLPYQNETSTAGVGSNRTKRSLSYSRISIKGIASYQLEYWVTWMLDGWLQQSCTMLKCKQKLEFKDQATLIKIDETKNCFICEPLARARSYKILEWVRKLWNSCTTSCWIKPGKRQFN